MKGFNLFKVLCVVLIMVCNSWANNDLLIFNALFGRGSIARNLGELISEQHGENLTREQFNNIFRATIFDQSIQPLTRNYRDIRQEYDAVVRIIGQDQNAGLQQIDRMIQNWENTCRNRTDATCTEISIATRNFRTNMATANVNTEWNNYRNFSARKRELQAAEQERQRQLREAEATNGRSLAEIMRVVRQNMASLQHAYNQRLRDNPGMQGCVTVKWAINESGNVIRASLVSSTINDETFEQTVVSRIRGWTFGRINIPGDITEVERRFVFTPD